MKPTLGVAIIRMVKSIQNIIFSFVETSLTHYGGMYIILRFCKKLRINALLYTRVQYFTRHIDFHPAKLIFIVIYTIIAGILRLSGNRILSYNGTFQKFLGLSAFPHPSRINSFLIHLDMRTLRGIIRLHDYLRNKLFHKPKHRNHITLDIDSTVLTVYGSQEGSAIGFNPHRKGYPSYHPLLCFEAHSRDFWHGVFRPGNTVSSSGAAVFLKECFAKIPKDIYRYRVRADSGFYAKDIIEFLDEQKAGYAIAVRVYPNFKRMLGGLAYKQFKKGYQVAEFRYRPLRWNREYRYIVVRRPIPEQPSRQLRLFTIGRFSYQILITNLVIGPEWVWRFYNSRWLAEQDIKELKENFTLGNIPTGNWNANDTYFNLLLFAYNIVNWFKRLCLPPQCAKWNMKTLRTELLVVPARLVKTHNKYNLNLPKNYLHKHLFPDTMKKIDSLKL